MTKIWARHALLEDGWAESVMVTTNERGEIAAVSKNTAPHGERVGILLPAPVNAHSHAFQRAMAGLTETRGPDLKDSFWTWRKLMFRFLDLLTPDQIEAIAALVQMEMLEAGYATNVEFHYLHHQPGGEPYESLSETAQRIAAAAANTGIGLTLLPVHYQFGGCDRRALGAGQIRFGNDAERFARLAEDSRKMLANLPGDTAFGVAPHSLRAVAPEDVKTAKSLAQGGPVHMHLAEQLAEVEEVRAALGARPVEWVLDNIDADKSWCFIHCTQMEPHETMGLATTGAIAGLCPITESSLGDGIFDGVRWRNAGGSLAIGSDSNIRISLSEELRMLDYSQRLRDRSRAALATLEKSTGRALFDAVCAGGSKAAGRRTGVIAPGYLADLTAMDDTHHDFTGQSGDRLLDIFAFAGSDAMITDVWSAGRHMVHGGRHVARDKIVQAYIKAVSPLRDVL